MIKPWKVTAQQTEPDGRLGITFEFAKKVACSIEGDVERYTLKRIQTFITVDPAANIDDEIHAFLTESGAYEEADEDDN